MKKTKNNNKIAYLASITIAVSFLFFVGDLARANASDNFEKEIINQVNQERAKQGLGQLKEDEILNEAAKLKAKDMIGNNYFAHTSPAGLDPWHWLDRVEYSYRYAGENLAMDFFSATTVHRAWMKSKTHKENILSEKYDQIGVAVLEGVIENKDRKVAVQFFGSPLLEKPEKEVAQETEEASPLVNIKEASVKPWLGSSTDEMLIYAEIEGKSEKVEAIIGKKTYLLEELQESRYLNLVSLEGIDLKNDQVIVKAEMGEGKAVFYQIPPYQYAGYLEEKSEDEQNQLTTAIASAGANNQLLKEKNISTQNLVMAGIMSACLIMIANVWVLEKEEEKLIDKVAKEVV